MTHIELHRTNDEWVWVARRRNVLSVPKERFGSPDEALRDLLEPPAPDDDPPPVAA